jgi:hypothetical protein
MDCCSQRPIPGQQPLRGSPEQPWVSVGDRSIGHVAGRACGSLDECGLGPVRLIPCVSETVPTRRNMELALLAWEVGPLLANRRIDLRNCV